MRENAATKARRYLTEGRVIVTHIRPGTVLRAHVRGDGVVYRCGWDRGTWWCTCPASTKAAACAHLIAVRLVTAPDLPPMEPTA